MTDTPEARGGLIESFVGLLNPDWVIGVVTLIMGVLAAIDLVTFLDRPLPWRREAVQHRDLKTAIVSLGILGTFIGITIGLIQFDTSDVHGSIPDLLSGLKVAFFTSVVGMALSIILAVTQRLMNANAGRDNTEQLDKIANLILQGDDANREGLDSLRKELTGRLEDIDKTLNLALERIARNANREIVDSLNEVVRKFNVIIQEQFGESLRQLGEACEKLLTWQEQHKEEVDAVHTQLVLSVAMLERAAETQDSLAKACERIEAVILGLDEQTQAAASHLKEYGATAEKIRETLQRAINSISDARGAIVELTTVSQTKFQEQVTALGEALSSMKETARRIEATNSEVATHAENTQKMLNAQTQQVDEMVRKSGDAMNSMEDSFVKVTQHLEKAYEAHLRQLSELVTVSESLREQARRGGVRVNE